MVEAIVAKHGRLDVVENNAGGSPYVLAAEASPKFHQKIVELNLLGMLHVSQAANAVMQTAAPRRIDRVDLLGPAPSPVAGYRGLQRREGRRGKPHHHPGGGVGTPRCGSTPSWWAWSRPSRPSCSNGDAESQAAVGHQCRWADWPNRPISVGGCSVSRI